MGDAKRRVPLDLDQTEAELNEALRLRGVIYPMPIARVVGTHAPRLLHECRLLRERVRELEAIVERQEKTAAKKC